MPSNLPFDTLAGLFNMLSDSSHEIRQQADAALSEFLQEIKNSPVSLSSTNLYHPVNNIDKMEAIVFYLCINFEKLFLCLMPSMLIVLLK
jgi:hypothetical protein